MNGQLPRRALAGLALAVALVSTPIGGGTGAAAPPCDGERQCYPGDWIERTDGAYYYRRYYFKTSTKDTEYKHHYVIYYPKDDWMYYFNPVARTYWCRAYKDVGAKDGKLWIVLPTGPLRKARIGEIPATAWARDREIPLIPGSHSTGDATDAAEMLAPPAPPRASK